MDYENTRRQRVVKFFAPQSLDFELHEERKTAEPIGGRAGQSLLGFQPNFPISGTKRQ